MFLNNKCNTFFGLNLTLVYTFPMCMAWRFHCPIRNYDFKPVFHGACFGAVSAPTLYAPYPLRVRPYPARIRRVQSQHRNRPKHAPWKTGFRLLNRDTGRLLTSSDETAFVLCECDIVVDECVRPDGAIEWMVINEPASARCSPLNWEAANR